MPFDRKKALCALQGSMVITDENSKFEWVGSQGASLGVIILIQALNALGRKVAACGHLIKGYSPYSIQQMMDKMEAKEVLTVHLVSGYVAEEKDPCPTLLE